MDAARLSSFKHEFTRARASILGHNFILWREGVIPRQGEITDLDLEDDDMETANASTGTYLHRSAFKRHELT